jgi:hypothetical protein
LKQECLSLRDIRQLRPQPIDLQQYSAYVPHACFTSSTDLCRSNERRKVS